MCAYNMKQIIRDILLKLGNPFNLVSFSPQHEKLIDLSPYSTVLHIGANIGQELSLYHHIRPSKVIWIEPDKRAFKILKLRSFFYRRFDNTFVNAFISDTTDVKTSFFKFNLSGANSQFKPTQSFLDSRKSRYVTEITSVTTLTIEDALSRNEIIISGENNLLVIDVQGNELAVINGFSQKTLEKFRVIMCEFSLNQYENFIKPDQLKKRLEVLGYKEVLAPLRSSDDAIFIKK